jgi:hypothetical protein
LPLTVHVSTPFHVPPNVEAQVEPLTSPPTVPPTAYALGIEAGTMSTAIDRINSSVSGTDDLSSNTRSVLE